MSLDDVVRSVVRDELRAVVREEIRAALSGVERSRESSGIFLQVKSAAEFADVCEDTVRKWMKEGRLPKHRVGKRAVRVRRDELEKLLQGPIECAQQSPHEVAMAVLKRGR